MTRPRHHLQPVNDQVLGAELEAAIDAAIERPWHIRPEFAARKNWLVVPVEKGRHFEPDDADRVARAMRSAGASSCFGVATEPTGPDPCCYAVPPSAAALLEFSDIFAGLNAALLPRDVAWLVLCTTEDYNLYAGPEAFVSACLETTVDRARAAFAKVAADPWWEGRLLTVARRYEDVPARGSYREPSTGG